MRRRPLPYLLIAPALVLLVLFALIPILNAFWTSLHHDRNLPGEARRFVGLQNYVELSRDQEARNSLFFSLLFVAVSVPVEIVLGLLIALVIHRSFRWRGWVRAAVLIPWAIPTVVTAWMWWYIFAGEQGIANLLLFGSDREAYIPFLTRPGWARSVLILADVWKTAPFAAILILAGLQTIPEPLYEAARLDGAGPLRRFFRITLPLLRPALLVALLFRTMDAFRVFDLVYVMTQGAFGTSVLQFLGYKRLIEHQEFGMGSAVSVTVFLLIAVVSVLWVRMMGTALFSGEARRG